MGSITFEQCTLHVCIFPTMYIHEFPAQVTGGVALKTLMADTGAHWNYRK